MAIEYTLDQRIEHLSPEVDPILRRELGSILLMLRQIKYPAGVVASMSRLCLILLDQVLATVGQRRPNDNLCACIEFAYTTKGTDGKALISNEVNSILHTIRILSNKADHAAESASLTLAEAEGALAMFVRVVQWFHVECSSGPRIAALTTLPGDSPPPAPKKEEPASAPLRLIPSPPSSFIGRADEIEKLNQLLDETRILTLIGSGGCGKTRLAIQLAGHERLEGSEICFIDLTAALSVEDVARLVHRALAVDMSVTGAGYERVASAIGGRNLLLVLDNCEQVVEEASNVSWALLNRCGGLRVLATSRQPLDVNGEVTYRVPSLKTPASRDIPVERLVQYDAVQLFIARARSIEPSFAVDNESAPAIADICSRLDGVPLALELAAARIRSMTPQEICERLHSTFKLIMGASGSAVKRHQTLRTTIEWSYNLLKPDEKALFRRLSVFQGGFRLRQAEDVCGKDPLDDADVLDLLEDLIDKSLVVAEKSGTTSRYRFLETVREFACDLHRTDVDSPIIQDAHSEAYCALAARSADRVRSMSQAEAFDEIEADRWNHASALTFAEASGLHERALAAAVGIWRFWYTRGYYDEGIALCERIFLNLPEAEPAPRAKLARILSLLCVSAGYDDRGETYATLNVELRRGLASEFDMAEALVNRGVVLLRIGRFDKATADAEECQAALERHGGCRPLWANLHTLGSVALHEERYSEALGLFDRSREGWQSVGDLRGVAKALDGRMACETGLSRLAEASATGQRLCSIWEDLEHAQGTATLLVRCAVLAARSGDGSACHAFLKSCGDFCRQKGIPMADEDERLASDAAAMSPGDLAPAPYAASMGSIPHEDVYASIRDYLATLCAPLCPA